MDSLTIDFKIIFISRAALQFPPDISCRGGRNRFKCSLNWEEVQRFIYNEHSAEYIQGDDAGGPGLQGWIGGKGAMHIYIYTQVQGKGEGKDSTRSPLLPLTLALLHNPRHSSKQTLQMGSGTGPGNLHTKREQVQTNSNSPTIQPQEAQSHQLQ